MVRCCLVTGGLTDKVHMKHIGCPLVGRLYAPEKSTPRLSSFLHSWILGFDHPRSGEPLLFRSFLHQELRSFLGEASPRDRERP